MGQVPDIAAAHFAAIVRKAEEVREKVNAADDFSLEDGEDIELRLDADDLVEDLIRLILDSPETKRVTLALAAPAGLA